MGAGGGGAPGGGVNAIHESLIKVLLRVDCIQPEVSDCIWGVPFALPVLNVR